MGMFRRAEGDLYLHRLSPYKRISHNCIHLISEGVKVHIQMTGMGTMVFHHLERLWFDTWPNQQLSQMSLGNSRNDKLFQITLPLDCESGCHPACRHGLRGLAEPKSGLCRNINKDHSSGMQLLPFHQPPSAVEGKIGFSSSISLFSNVKRQHLRWRNCGTFYWFWQ